MTALHVPFMDRFRCLVEAYRESSEGQKRDRLAALERLLRGDLERIAKEVIGRLGRASHSLTRGDLPREVLDRIARNPDFDFDRSPGELMAWFRKTMTNLVLDAARRRAARRRAERGSTGTAGGEKPERRRAWTDLPDHEKEIIRDCIERRRAGGGTNALEAEVFCLSYVHGLKLREIRAGHLDLPLANLCRLRKQFRVWMRADVRGRRPLSGGGEGS